MNPWLLACSWALLATPAVGQALAAYSVQGEGASARIEQPLAAPGDAARGRTIAASRQQGLCLLCHSAPVAEERFQGNLAPNLAGIGSRLSEGQLRLRVVESRRVNPDSFMPAFHSTTQLSRVAGPWLGQPILSAQQVEDVVAWLVSLR